MATAIFEERFAQSAHIKVLKTDDLPCFECGLSQNSACPSFFDGADCSEIECLNGGYRSPGQNYCTCPPGYLGIHCEAVKQSQPPDNHFKASRTSFNIINVNLFTQFWGVKTYSNIVQGLANHFSAFPNGYDNYNLLQTNSSPYLDFTEQPVLDIQFADVVTSKEFGVSAAVDTGLYWCYQVPIYEQIVSLIRSASLRNTVISIVTQHPPSSDGFADARETALAFGVRVNVLWISDKTFMRCDPDEVTAFKSFVDITGGLFVQLRAKDGDVDTQTLITQVLQTHYKPQYVSIQSFPDCSGAGNSVPVVIDPNVQGPYNFFFLGDNANPSQSSFVSCFLRQPVRSFDNQLAVFQSPDPTCSSLNITTSSGSCTAIVFTNAAPSGPLDLAIYTTYVEDQSIDSSRYAIIESVPFYPAFHVEAATSSSGSQVIVNSISSSFDSSWSPTLSQRVPAAFEWIPSKPVTCDATQTYSLFLNISVDSTIIQRSVRVACVAIPTATTQSSTTGSTGSTSFISSTDSSTAAPTSSLSSSTSFGTTTEEPEYCDVGENAATFVFAYSTELNQDTNALVRNTIIQAISSNQNNYTKLGNVLTDTAAGVSIVYTESALDFSTSCLAMPPNATLKAADNVASDALNVLRDFLAASPTTRRLEGSMIVLLVNRLPKVGDDLTDEQYDQLTNNNVKVFAIISHASLIDESMIGRSGAVLNRIAAQTNGHYVAVSEVVGRDGNSDFNRVSATLMNTAYIQNLIFTRNIGVNRPGTDLGVLRVPSSPTGKVTLTITASFSAVDVNVPQPPSTLLLGFLPNGNATKTISIDFLDRNVATSYDNANFYTTTIELEAGYNRELFLKYVPGPDQSDLLIRMWTVNDAYHHVGYVGFDELNGFDELAKVDEYVGAALRVKLYNDCYSDKTATLLITDCNGKVSAKYDADQAVPIDNVWTDEGSYPHFPFVPFFCDSKPGAATCVDGADSKYDAQFVSAGFSITRSFQCRPGTGGVNSNCQLKDSNGNYQCAGTVPFKRGPTGNLTDCSNHGHLELVRESDDPDQEIPFYGCICDDGYSGKSCEQVNCTSKSTDYLAIDNSYHTYTVVLGLEVSNSLTLVLEDAQTYFGLSGLLPVDLKTVWKYQLITYCADGYVDMIYAGSDLQAFQNSFEFTTSMRACDADATPGAVDLTSVYKKAVEGVGRNTRGVIVYYSEVSNLLNVTLDAFVTASQAYEQQLFVYGLDESSSLVPMNDGIAQAAMTTGGFLIQSIIDLNGVISLEKTFIPSLLASSSSIAWYSTAQTDDFSYYTSAATTNTYMFTWKASIDLVNKNPDLLRSCVQGVDTSLSCQLTGQTSYTVKGNLASGAYYAAVYVLDDVAAKAQIISDLSRDSSNAVSTSTSDTRTMLSIRVPDGYTVVANDADGGVTRNAQRSGCSFGWTAYSIFATQKYAAGANAAKVTLQSAAGSGSTTKYTRFFAFGTSSGPVCRNGGTAVVSTGSCACPDGFQGPDCSLVVCSPQSSVSNAWSDVCVCSAIDDVACASQYTSPKSLNCQTPQWTSTFFFAYSYQLDVQLYDKVVPIVVDALNNNSYRDNVLRDAIIDAPSETIEQPKDIDEFSSNLVSSPPRPVRNVVGVSNVAAVLQLFFPTASETSEYSGKTTNWLENSVLLILPTFLPVNTSADLPPENYTSLVNKNVKVFVAMSRETLEEQKSALQSAADLTFFFQLATRTNGHFIIYRSEDVERIVATIMRVGYSKDLLFTRNFRGLEQRPVELGTLRTANSISGGKLNFTITMTQLSDSIPSGSRFLSLCTDDEACMVFEWDPLNPLTCGNSSNVFCLDISLTADTVYRVKFSGTAQDVSLRIWTDRVLYQYAEYVDLDFYPTNPDDKEGAALRMTVLDNCYQEARARVSITDCSGLARNKTDEFQVSGRPIGTEGSYPKFAFVPYFCDASTSSGACYPGTENKYDVQVTTGSYSVTRSFECLPGIEPLDPDCTQTDQYGNVYCARKQLPYKRGPTGQLTDCSSHGALQFDSINAQDYVCVCDSGYSGVSCEKSV
ncbi:unnamed protein product [Caenorhabditis sp. 36 PRJEB53466]|nr:unnamed protein product [Caenorhabditis sp. 36 PRJEB53466]